MKVQLIPMDKVADNPEGQDILRVAHEAESRFITQRLMPENTAEDHDGAYLLMVLDWEHAMIIRMTFTGKEIINLTDILKGLSGMKVLDGFDTEGATIQ